MLLGLLRRGRGLGRVLLFRLLCIQLIARSLTTCSAHL